MNIGDVNRAMDSLTVAASGTVIAYSDVLVRGYLKEPPAEVLHRLELLEGMIRVVRTAAADGHDWPGYDGDPGAQHQAEVEEFAQHHCNCDHCLHAEPGHDPAWVEGAVAEGQWNALQDLAEDLEREAVKAASGEQAGTRELRQSYTFRKAAGMARNQAGRATAPRRTRMTTEGGTRLARAVITGRTPQRPAEKAAEWARERATMEARIAELERTELEIEDKR